MPVQCEGTRMPVHVNDEGMRMPVSCEGRRMPVDTLLGRPENVCSM